MLLDSAYKALAERDTLSFKKLNSNGLNLSIQQKDSFAIADAYWNYGDFFDLKEQKDSSYFYYHLAKNSFDVIGQKRNKGKMLYNMAVIQKSVKDFTGSEITTFKAIASFNEKEHQKNLYNCYNLLGVIHYNLNETNKSIEAHNKAVYFLKQIQKKGTSLEASYNNIGLTYQKAKNHKEAINNFNKVLERDSLKWFNPSLYAKALDNRAYNKFLSGDTLGIKKEFDKALKIRDSINYISGIIKSKLHISEFLAFKKDTLKALELTKQALALAKEIKNNNERLLALKQLSNLDMANASNYLDQYIKLDDSLKVEEKKIRNKFTRISYETDKFIEEADKQKKGKITTIILSTLIVMLLVTLFYIRIQRAKNKRLTLENEQQKDREQIYQLMLKQEQIHQEAKTDERKRISEDLHDAILGGLCGVRMNLGFLDLTEESRKEFDNYLGEISNIEKEIRNISHALKSNIFNSQSNYIATIQKYIENINTNNALKVSFTDNSNLDWENISDDIKINCFRIVQEAYYNTVKYAEAENFDVNFSTEEDRIILTIKDNGIGFDVNKKRKGIGLKNIHSRVKKLGGVTTITSKPNQGTQIKVCINKHMSNGKG